MIIASPVVVSNENDAADGFSSKVTPIAARMIPDTVAVRNLSLPATALTISVKIGIVTASNDAFAALVNESPPTKSNWLKTTPKRLKIARRT